MTSFKLKNVQSMHTMSSSDVSSVEDFDLVKLKINSWKYKINSILKIRKDWVREFLAELVGTFIFVSFGLATIAQQKFKNEQNTLIQNVGFAFSLTSGILVAGKVTGGHLSPAVSLSMVLMGRLSFSNFLTYINAQLMGSIFASSIVFLVYFNQFQKYPGGMFSLETAGIFATYPKDINDPNSILYCFLNEFIATMLFIIVVLAVTDKKNYEIPLPSAAVLIGLCLLVVETSFGFISGCSINPARDLGPRYFTLIAGWGTQVLSAGNYFFWVPLVAPMIGAILGSLIYHLFIGNSLPQERF